jgi:acyl-CoA thioesterase-2
VLVIRRAQPTDVDGIARVHTESGDQAYRQIVPAELLDAPGRIERRKELWEAIMDRLADQGSGGDLEAVWVAVDTTDPTTVFGVLRVDRCHDDDASDLSGEIVTLYVDTERQGEGIGERLLQRGVDHLLACGCNDLRLWTFEENERAQAFYAARGWTRDGATRIEPSYATPEVRFRTDPEAVQTSSIRQPTRQLIDVLLPHSLGDGRYVAEAPGWFGPRVFGGAVVGHVIGAASLAAGDAGRAHSLHTHFLRAVHPGPVELRVEPIRTGRTFTTNRVDSVQDGRVAATSVVSFHSDEDDVPYQLPMPDVPRPESLPIAEDAPPPFELRWIGPTEPRPDGTYESTRRCWLRTVEDVPEDPLADLLVLAFLSDLTGTSFRPYSLGEWGTHTDASIDHAVWFHRPPRTDGWLYCDFHALINAGGRSTVRGQFYDEDGLLVLSMAQELLIRPLG